MDGMLLGIPTGFILGHNEGIPVGVMDGQLEG